MAGYDWRAGFDVVMKWEPQPLGYSQLYNEED